MKLADFGASRLISSSTSVNNASMRGTPNYMAPEVIKQSSRSRKSDIWSVGCSVLRLLTGLPFWGDTKFDSHISLLYYVAHLETLPPLPGELSDDARSFVTACLEIDPVLRPSALELLQHPFVRAFDPMRSPPMRSARIQSAPPATDTFSRNLAAARGPSSSQTASRALHSAPSPLNLPDLRGATTVAPARQDKFTELSSLPNAFDLPVRVWLACALSGCGGRKCGVVTYAFSLSLYATAPQEEVEEQEQVHGEASIPSLSTTVFSSTFASPATALQHKKRTPKHSQLPSLASSLDADRTNRTDAVAGGGTREYRMDQPQPPRATWEEQPILTDAARLEREQRLASLAAEKRTRDERERRFQDELVEFRRQMGHHH